MSSEEYSLKFNSASRKAIKDIQTLFTDYDPTSHQIRIDALKPLFKCIVDTQDLISEAHILKECVNFGEIYGMFEITSEIFHIFSQCYKRIQDLSHAKTFAKNSIIFIQKSHNPSKIFPRYLIYLASIISAQKLFHKSLKILKTSRKLIKSLMSNAVSPDKELRQLFIINIYNIAIQEESLDLVRKSFKHYEQCRDLIMKYKLNFSINFYNKVSQGISRLEIYNRSIKNSKKAVTATPSNNHSRRNSQTLNSGALLKHLFSIQNKTRKKSEDLSLPSRQRIILKNKKGAKTIKKPLEAFRIKGFDKVINFFESNDKLNPFELSQRISVKSEIKEKSEVKEKRASLSISDTNSFNFAPIFKDDSRDRNSDSSEIEEFNAKNLRNISETLHRALSRTLSFRREERSSDASIKIDDIEKMNLANCIMADELEIDANFYKTFFQMAEDGQLLVTCQKDKEMLYGSFPIPEGQSILEYINDHVKKTIIKKNNRLELSQEKSLTIIKGIIHTDASQNPYSIELRRLCPRWTIEVKIGVLIKSFEIKEIFANMK